MGIVDFDSERNYTGGVDTLQRRSVVRLALVSGPLSVVTYLYGGGTP
jgi:hypothetical protein